VDAPPLELQVALCHLLNVPGECPDKNPIPACDFKFSTCEECLEMKDADIEEIGCRDEKLRSLREMDEEETGRVSFIRGDYRVSISHIPRNPVF